MDELLSLAIKAHGGLDRWSAVTSVQAATSITGAIWYLKEHAVYLRPQRLQHRGDLPPIEVDGETWRRLKVTIAYTNVASISTATVTAVTSRLTSSGPQLIPGHQRDR